MFELGKTYVVDKFPRRNARGLVVYADDTDKPIKAPRGSKLIYMGQNPMGSYLFLLRGTLVQVSGDIARYLITLDQYLYKKQLLDALNGR